MSDATLNATTKTEIDPIVRHKMRGRNKLLLIIFSLLMMGVLRTGFVFLIIALLPSIVAYYMDISKHRYTYTAIFSSNFAAVMPYLGRMLHHGPSSSVLQEIMGSAATWIIIYGAAFMGWLLVQTCPMFAQSIVRNYHQGQVARFERMQKKIESEWGPEVTQFSSVPEDND